MSLEENARLKADLENLTNQVNGYVAQLESHKHMLSEVIQSSLNLRATMCLVNKNAQEVAGKLKVSEDNVAALNKQLSELKEKDDAANQKCQ